MLKTVFLLPFILVLVFIFQTQVHAQDDAREGHSGSREMGKDNLNDDGKDLRPAEITRMEEITVTATRHGEKVFNVPYTANVINSNEIQMRMSFKTTPEVLREETGVMVQKTSHGQGSPYIRGFTGYHTLMLIDGIRLNNSTFREGPNQYWNTIDPYSIQRMELIKGPGSVLYGSDAIGGTVNAITKARERYGKGLLYNGSAYYRYASGEDSQIGRVEGSAGYDDKLGIFAGGTYKDFGDMIAGDDMGLLRNTGYDEADGDIKLEYFFDKNKKLTFAFQTVDQNNVPRTHKTIHSKSFHGTTIGTDIKRDFDQDRTLAYLQFHWDKISRFIERAKISLSYQHQREEQDRVRGDGRMQETEFNVYTYGIWAQLESVSPIGHLTYGFDLYHDNVTSSRSNFNAAGMLTSVGIQGTVADDATYDLFGAYLQDEITLGDKFEITAGLRYTYAAVDADKVADPVSGGEIDINDNWGNVVGSLRAIYYPADNWNVFAGVSQGFRAPNLSDMTRFQADSTFETPTTGLDSEDFTTFEIGAKADFAKWSGQVSYYYTFVDDMIVRSPTGDFIGGTPEVRKDNIGDGFVTGVEAGLSYSPFKQWTAFGNFTWIDGEVKQFEDGQERDKPFDRLMPVTGRFGIRWEMDEPRIWVEGQTTIVNNQDDLSLRDRVDTDRIPMRGTPGYTIYTLRGGIEISEHLNISIAAENLTDKNYRIHGSGQNEPGLNFIISTTLEL